MMAEKKLTKAQREILETLRDKPGARIIYHSTLAPVYRLFVGRERIKSIRSGTLRFLRPWLNQGRDAYGGAVHTFKTGAEISDEWRSQEVERHRVETERLRQERRIEEAEEGRQQAERLKAAFAAIEHDALDDNKVEYYSNVIRFEYGGRWYSLIEEAGLEQSF